MSDLSQSVRTISKCPNYLKMSQLSHNVPTHYFKLSQLPREGKFACTNKLSWRIIPLTNIRIVRKYASWLSLCEIMREILKYAKMCGKHQIVRKVAENVTLWDTAPTKPKRCPCFWLIVNIILTEQKSKYTTEKKLGFWLLNFFIANKMGQ